VISDLVGKMSDPGGQDSSTMTHPEIVKMLAESILGLAMAAANYGSSDDEDDVKISARGYPLFSGRPEDYREFRKNWRERQSGDQLMSCEDEQLKILKQCCLPVQLARKIDKVNNVKSAWARLNDVIKHEHGVEYVEEGGKPKKTVAERAPVGSHYAGSKARKYQLRRMRRVSRAAEAREGGGSQEGQPVAILQPAVALVQSLAVNAVHSRRQHGAQGKEEESGEKVHTPPAPCKNVEDEGAKKSIPTSKSVEPKPEKKVKKEVRPEKKSEDSSSQDAVKVSEGGGGNANNPLQEQEDAASSQEG